MVLQGAVLAAYLVLMAAIAALALRANGDDVTGPAEHTSGEAPNG